MAVTTELAHPIKQRLQAGDVALGMPVRLSRSGDIARIAKSTGHDFLFIDCQHSLFNLETIGHITSTAMSCGDSASGPCPRHQRPGRVATAG
jgi:2-keto-3-deoxy-L-rhamnonate aldolase RhmA